MPELPEVEVLVRHLAPLLEGQKIRTVEVRRDKSTRPTPLAEFQRTLAGARFTGLSRRGKYLLFTLDSPSQTKPIALLGHLGMTGRMFLQAADAPLPKHAAVVLGLGPVTFVFEDTRYFGRLTLDSSALNKLGPEPLGDDFTPAGLAASLRRSAQPIKVKLLDQTVVAGVGNIYASEALFRARISPRLSARRLSRDQVRRVWRAVREVLAAAIRWGSTVPLDWKGQGADDGFFYYGRSSEAPADEPERLYVYDRHGQPCVRCGAVIRRRVQAARSTFYCPRCQRT